jgi:phosphodiesterase/alkaline phosphatase D-like protein
MDTPSAARVEFGHCNGSFRSFPPLTQKRVKFLLGSCNLHSLGVFQDPDPAYTSLLRIADDESVDFMIHCGDQIYYDIPDFGKEPDLEEYRDKYLDAWGDSRPTRKFLTQLPHYMILDDHELVNNFSNDMNSGLLGSDARHIKDIGVRVYREFQHLHNPQTYGSQPLYYSFSFGAVQFFVLDTRTERYTGSELEKPKIIDNIQMNTFLDWLNVHRTAVKFVVSSVPFVTHVENDKDGKWSNPVFRTDRERVLNHIIKNNIKKVTFLTGDMHNSYHAEMTLKKGDNTIRINELMSSPINQIQKTSRDRYKRERNKKSNKGKFSYSSALKNFYNKHSNAMLISVNGNNINYEIFRTRKLDRKETDGSFTV